MRTSWLSLVVILAISIPLVWCFGSSLTGDRVFAYRDAAHFYYPLEAWVCDRWSRGQWPLWNAQDGNGTQVVADATSAVFYPGKLVFALPLEFARCYVWYIILHVLLAVMGAYRLARHWHSVPQGGAGDAARGRGAHKTAATWSDQQQLSRPAAGLSAVAYAFGGTVLFQYCNVAFLVGAAWLPWALLATHRMLTDRSVCWALVVGICLALMVLGGDPQTAYHAGLLGIIYAVIARRAAPSSIVPRGSQGPAPWPRSPDRGHALKSPYLWRDWLALSSVSAAGRALGLLAVAGISGALMAAVQIVPAWSWVTTSDRAVFTYPRSVYEVPAYLRRGRPVVPASRDADLAASPDGWKGVAQGLGGNPVESEHHRQAYRFSVAPWRLIEMLWPNVSGRTFPQNHRWLTAVGGEDRIWTPSLYLGVLPLLLGIGTWRLRRTDLRVRFLSWIFLLAVVGSFGWYGLSLLLQSVQRVFTNEPSNFGMAEPVGGLYWLMIVWLPGYVHFRYPAKLMIIASLAMAGLAGIGLDQMLVARRDRFARWLRNVGAVSLLAAVVVGVTRSWWTAWLAQANPDELYGPLDSRAAWLDALMACVHTSLVCGVGWWLLRRQRLHAVRLGVLFLLLTACEIAWANGWMVLTAPTSAMGATTVMSGVPDPSSPSTIYRWPSRTWVPPEWRWTSSRSRAEENLRWDVATLYAKLHLLGPHRSLLPQSTIVANDFRTFVSTGGQVLPHPSILDVLGVAYLIVPDDLLPPGPARMEITSSRQLPGVRVWRNLDAFPRAWIVHDVVAWPSWESADPRTIRQYFSELLFPLGHPRDFRNTAVVESAGPAALPELSRPANSGATESAKVSGEGGNRVELAVTLTAPGLVVLNQFYDPRWVVDIRSDAVTTYRTRTVRTNRIMQGVFLRAGTHCLVFRYVPLDLYGAGAVSLISWLVVLVGLGGAAWKRRRRAGQI
jgi:hypothetical protein